MSFIADAVLRDPAEPATTGLDLGAVPRGFRGRIRGLRAFASGGLPAEELERRLLEFGFVEGARVEVLHEGLFGRDPIAMRVDDMRVALRRREAAAVLVELDPQDRAPMTHDVGRPARSPASPWSAIPTAARPPCSTP